MRRLPILLSFPLCLVAFAAVAELPARPPVSVTEGTHPFELRIADRKGDVQVFHAEGAIGFRQAVRFVSTVTGEPERVEVTLHATRSSEGKVLLSVHLDQLSSKRHVQWSPIFAVDPGATSVARIDWGSGDGLTATLSLK